MHIFYRTVPVFLTLLCAGASAQSTEAARYVNPQGIEVIQARRPPAVEENRQGADKPTPVSKPAPAGTMAAVAPVVRLASSKLQITAQEQRGRDEDRLAILKTELSSESGALDTKLRILGTPAMQAKLTADELKRVQETAADHERNIRALNVEIGRVKLAR